MAKANNIREMENVQEHLQRIIRLLGEQELAEERIHVPHADLIEPVGEKPDLAELQSLLDRLHPADVAHILEALPLEERLIVWDMVKAERDGEILLEVSDAVRETLLATMNSGEMLAAAEQLDADEIADIASDLPSDVIHDVFQSLPMEEREKLRSAMSYAEDAVGALMDFDVVTIREEVKLEVVLRYLRRLDELPDHTDLLFVVAG